MARLTEGDFLAAFPSSRFAAQRLLEKSTINYSHEADALRQHVQRMRVMDAPINGGLPDFGYVGSHRCSQSCRMIAPPANTRVYECLQPEAHPFDARNNDGSVLHRWSGDVSICYDFGVPHICTIAMCTHQSSDGHEIICGLSRKVLGVPAAGSWDMNRAFESGKAMTLDIHQNNDTLAIQARVDEWTERLPEFRAEREARAKPAHSSDTSLKRQIDLSGLLGREADPARTAGPVGLLPPARRLALPAPETNRPGQLLDPPCLMNDTPTRRIRSSIVGSGGPSEEEIRGAFEGRVGALWDLLQRAYSWRSRMQELTEAQGRVISRCVDRRRGGSTDPMRKPTFDTVASLHAEETCPVLEGLEWVRIMASSPTWTSGDIRRVESKQLVDRMYRLWLQIIRSPRFHTDPQPHSYRAISGALLTLAIEGHQISLCMIAGEKETFLRLRCSHRSNSASAADCGHQKFTLQLVAPARVMSAILAPPGIRQRAYDRARGHVLGHLNTIHTYLASLFEEGLPRANLRAVCVPEYL